MPFKRNSELPKGVRNALPAKAQTIYRKAFNSAESDGMSDERASKIAWGAVKNAGYEKSSDGKWVKKSIKNQMSTLVENVLWNVIIEKALEPTESHQDEFQIDVDVISRDLEKGIVYGEVLVPNEVDAQEDYVSPEEIENAAHTYLVRSRKLDYRHDRFMEDQEAVLVESYVAPTDFNWNGRKVKKGTWVVGVKIYDEDVKDEVSRGDLNSFSIVGRAQAR